MAMPGMSGRETYYELSRLKPDVKVLLASGFRQDARIDQLLERGVKGFIKKPFTFRELVSRLYEVIHGE